MATMAGLQSPKATRRPPAADSTSTIPVGGGPEPSPAYSACRVAPLSSRSSSVAASSWAAETLPALG